jgi:glutathione synthase/RimK-type ligase-like ATP-grasp enzyme
MQADRIRSLNQSGDRRVQWNIASEGNRRDGYLIVAEDCAEEGLHRRRTSAREFFQLEPGMMESGVQVLNLCASYSYLSPGYYCSLLAEARGQAVMPSVKTINEIACGHAWENEVDVWEGLLNDALVFSSEGLQEAELIIDVFLGQTNCEALQQLVDAVFHVFPAPWLQIRCAKAERWTIRAVTLPDMVTMAAQQRLAFEDALERHERGARIAAGNNRRQAYRIAILHDANEVLPPSNRDALDKFVQAGQKIGAEVCLIEQKDCHRLTSFDALFIRETTAVNHHTYWMAKQAERAGLAVIDDPQSIQRCTNKVFLDELLRTKNIPAPRSVVMQRCDLSEIARIEEELGYPMVMKAPDGAFCRGVSKASNRDEFLKIATSLLAQSSLILVQEYLYTDFDWRIGVLDRQILFASQYYMSAGHWQVAKRDAKGHAQFGMARAVALTEVPSEILRHALDAANLIGDGLYGVDMKMSKRGAVVIEVNDNPNIDHGIEDGILGDELYVTVLRSLIARTDAIRTLAR